MAIKHENSQFSESSDSFACIRLPKNASGPTFTKGPVAKWIRHQPSELGIVGSSPTWVIFERLHLNWLCKEIKDDKIKVAL